MFTRPRVLTVLLVLALVTAVIGVPLAGQLAAQDDVPRAAFGDPPIAELITLSEPDEEGLVTIRGAEGAVFPAAVVAVRNMYTGQTVYDNATVNGAFDVQIYGPGNTPFWISPAARIDAAERNVPGSLPGGPGVILAGPLPDHYPGLSLPEPAPADLPETSITIDGDTADWADLAVGVPIDLGEGRGGLVYALANTESLYLAVAPAGDDSAVPNEYTRLEIGLELEGRLFSIVFDPRRGGGGMGYTVIPETTTPDAESPVGPLGGLSAQGQAIELRVPRLAFTGWAAPVKVRWLRFMDGLCCGQDWLPVSHVDLFLPVDEVEALDSRAVTPLDMPRDAVPFTLSGPVGGGSGTWHAVGQISGWNVSAGGTLRLEMQVTMQAPTMPGDGGDLRLGAVLSLLPVFGPDGAPAAAGQTTGSGWSDLLTPTGLPVENVPGRVRLGDATAQGLASGDETLTFALQWQIPLDDSLADGLYVPVVEGYAAVTGVVNAWSEGGLLGDGPGAGVVETRLPVTLNVGDPVDGRMLWTLFQDQPSGSGGRGILPVEDAATAALSSRVVYNAGRYVLPRFDPASGDPIPYPLEPYLPALLPNSFFATAPPLLPLDVTTGEITVAVTRPDGTVDDLGVVPLAQNRLSTSTRLESQALGATSPVDVYRLTTLDPRLTAYTFEQDGSHTITLTGFVRDVWGTVYHGGGTYQVWVAEPLLLLPGVLPGTPFEAGDAFNPALTVAPAFPADVSIRLRVFPLDGADVIEYAVEGAANEFGYFHPGRAADPWLLETPGEYVVDVTASYTDPLGRLWMGSQRGAGVIASPEAELVARGGRGLANLPADDRLAWYALDHTAPDVLAESPEAHLRWPYHSGDVLWSRDDVGSLAAVLRVTDTGGTYQSWLLDRLPGWRADDGQTLGALANEDELPLLTVSPSESGAGHAYAYAYLSAVRPGIAARQFVSGYEPSAAGQSVWRFDDPYNHQRGMGFNGDSPGDYTFLFGGAVLQNEALDRHEAAIYGALAVVIDPDDPRGDRVYPPFRGAANGPDGGPLLTVGDVPVEMFFAPTGFRPGQIFRVGETLALSGQVAPTLPAHVEADIVMPSGRVLPIIGQANAVGYFHDPSQNLALTEVGIWQVRVRVSYDGLTSAGPVQPPYPSGGLPASVEGLFEIFVVPVDAPRLELNNRPLADEMVSPAFPFNLTAAIPPDWEQVQAAYVLAMPDMILFRDVQPAPGDIYTVTCDPRRLHQAFPNLDIRQGDTQNPLAVDTVLITLALSGLDATGEPVIAARTVTLFGDRLLILDDGWPTGE